MANEVQCKEVKKSPAWMLAVLLVFPILVWAVAWLAAGDSGILGIGKWGRPTAFVVIIFLMTAFCFVVGKAVTGLWRGLLIDGRNWMSLSRFQTTAWTILVLSAILVAAFGNMAIKGKPGAKLPEGGVAVQGKPGWKLPEGGPLDFGIPQEIWLVMGISVTSLIGSPLIRSTKKDKPPTDMEANRASDTLAAQGETMQNEGQLLVRPCPEDASWGDLFRAEEVGSAAHLDLGKVQNFYFTLILLFAYGQALFSMFGDPPGVVKFPDMSGGMAAFLAISHAAYLANKARPQSQTAAPGEQGVVDTETAKVRLQTVASAKAAEAARKAQTGSATGPGIGDTAPQVSK